MLVSHTKMGHNSSISVQIAFAALPYQQDFDIKEYLAAAYRMGRG